MEAPVRKYCRKEHETASRRGFHGMHHSPKATFHSLRLLAKEIRSKQVPYWNPNCNRTNYNSRRTNIAENYQSARAAFEENPEIGFQAYAAIADILDQGDCAEVKKNKDGTPKVIQVRREIK